MRAAVLGDPIGHSLSPVIHRAAYAELGLDWDYDKRLVRAGDLASFVEGLDLAEWRGLSLTMPLKREAVSLLTSQDDWVTMSGAANTVLLSEDGSRHGLNTDVPAAVELLAQHEPARTAVVLGGGATAVSMLLALAERGLESGTLVVRSPERAVESVRAVGQHPHAPVLQVVSIEEAGAQVLSADVVVSTVPVTAQTPPVVASLLDAPLVFEVVYNPWPTPLAAAAERGGASVIHGLDLLLGQAALQVTAMTGAQDVPLEAMRQAAEEELATTWNR